MCVLSITSFVIGKIEGISEDEEISEEELKQKREKHDYSESMNSLAIITGDNLKEIKRIIQDVLTQWCSTLSKVLRTDETPTFKDIMTEFQLGMDIICNYQRLVKHCELFLQTLVNEGGPPKEAAICIAKEWTDNIKRKLDITIEFNIIE